MEGAGRWVDVLTSRPPHQELHVGAFGSLKPLGDRRKLFRLIYARAPYLQQLVAHQHAGPCCGRVVLHCRHCRHASPAAVPCAPFCTTQAAAKADAQPHATVKALAHRRRLLLWQVGGVPGATVAAVQSSGCASKDQMGERTGRPGLLRPGGTAGRTRPLWHSVGFQPPGRRPSIAAPILRAPRSWDRRACAGARR